MIIASFANLTVMLAAAASMMAPAAKVPAPAQPVATAVLWRTVAASGDVTVLPARVSPAQWLPLHRGDDVVPLSHVRTQAKGNATLTRDGDVVMVAPGSDVVMPERDPDGMTRVQQRTGKAHYQVSPRSSGRFEVQTPMLVAGVKGTEFSIVIEQGRAAVSVVRGHVEVLSLLTGEKQDLFAGDSTIVDARERSMEMRREQPEKERRPRRDAPADAPPSILEEASKLNQLAETTTAVTAELDRSLWDDFGDGSLLKDPSSTDTGTTSTTTADPVCAITDVVGTVTDPLAPKTGGSTLTPVYSVLNGILKRP